MGMGQSFLTLLDRRFKSIPFTRVPCWAPNSQKHFWGNPLGFQSFAWVVLGTVPRTAGLWRLSRGIPAEGPR